MLSRRGACFGALVQHTLSSVLPTLCTRASFWPSSRAAQSRHSPSAGVFAAISVRFQLPTVVGRVRQQAPVKHCGADSPCAGYTGPGFGGDDRQVPARTTERAEERGSLEP